MMTSKAIKETQSNYSQVATHNYEAIKKHNHVIPILLLLSALLIPARSSASVEVDTLIPQLAFAAEELNGALKDAGKEDLQITLTVEADTSNPQAFQIKCVEPGQIQVVGSDASGAMYGGLEVADRLKLGLPIGNKNQKPFIEKRGIKFNIPLDVRTPSYDDSGDAAQRNVETVWDFSFWEEFLDDMARYRYNVLSLWNDHPYPSMIKLEKYPNVALDDVYCMGLDMKQEWSKGGNPGPWGEWDGDFSAPGTLKLIKRMTIDEKIAHWQKVFEYAQDRGIEIHLYHWNVFTFGATGKYGITPKQDNPITIDYTRDCVREVLETYPQISGIGVTAGENADNHMEGEYSIQNFLFNTFGKGIMDVKEKQPDRDILFIFRQHMTGLDPIMEAFTDYPYEFNTEFKYSIDNVYAMRRPRFFEERGFRKEVEKHNVPCWMHLRNDHIYVLRWGNPEFVQEFLRRMPNHLSPGYFYGSDGYVWGRDFIAKNPKLAGQLDIDKHWYQFQLWGRLGYNNELSNDYWKAVLKQRFPSIDAETLFQSWKAVSEIIPLFNVSCFTIIEAFCSPEGCTSITGYLTVDRLYFKYKPMSGSGMHSVQEWGKAVFSGKTLPGITPPQVADMLDAYAETGLNALPQLQKQAGDNVELQETLKDIESMAYLGRYYADKMRGAAKLAVFREDRNLKQYGEEAVNHLKDAAEEWRAYASIASAQYKPQLLSRTHFLDWNSTLKEVEKEVVTVQNEIDYPELRFTNLKDGQIFPTNTNLQVEIDATDKQGIRECKLYLNGLLLNANETNPQRWDSSNEPLLKSMKPGFYHVEAVAEDKTGSINKQAITITVGDAEKENTASWKDEIYQVILNEGERLKDGDVRNFPRLECYLFIDGGGRLELDRGTPEAGKGMIWEAIMHRDLKDPQYVTVEKGQLIIYRAETDKQDVRLFETPAPAESGNYKLGITHSRNLIVFSEDEKGERSVSWKSLNNE